MFVNSAYSSSIAFDLSFDPDGVVSNLRTISSFSLIVKGRRGTMGGVAGILIVIWSVEEVMQDFFKSSSCSIFSFARARRSAASLRRVATCTYYVLVLCGLIMWAGGVCACVRTDNTTPHTYVRCHSHVTLSPF